MTTQFQPGKLVKLRGRDWIVLPSESQDVLIIRPMGGSEEETTGIFLPLQIESDQPKDSFFPLPNAEDIGDISTARTLYDSARLAFRNGAGPFRCLAKLSFRPRAYQMVPLIMALRQDTVRLLIADDVGVGKTVEALLIVREMLERRTVKRFAVVCLPHLCEQWQHEIRDKLDIEAVIIRSNTQARLDRQIQGDTSVYDYYPYQIISVDYIKSGSRRDVFIEQCPELVIVDEAHSCARPIGASSSQQQRHHLISRIASKQGQHLVLLTATPHSGKPEEFHSLLGLLHPAFEILNLPNSSQNERRELARFFVQRKRADVEKWMNEDTPFPKRDPFEWPYELSKTYESFFEDILDFVRKMISKDPGAGHKRVQYWTALSLLRGVMSSPAAGKEMLNTRLDKLTVESEEKVEDNDTDVFAHPAGDTEYGYEGDNAPTHVMEKNAWTSHQRQQLRDFSKKLDGLSNIESDTKIASAELILDDWLKSGFKPVVFCRYIATANYVGEILNSSLKIKYHNLDIQIITSDLPDDVRKQKIEAMGKSTLRLLIATDCLSEGINLQDNFTAVLHYDLPWNPNRLEQREGRVDRFGQIAPEVKACLLYGADNPIDGIVLDVLLRKVREIKKSTGINVPFPDDSQSIIDTITQALLLNPKRKVHTKGKIIDYQMPLQFDYEDLDEATKAKANITRLVDEAAEREKVSRGIFAQNAIKAQEIEKDLREVDEAIGDPKAVEEFVTSTLNNIFGVQISPDKKGYRIVPGNLPGILREFLPPEDPIKVSFDSPTPKGYHYLGRNNRFVEQLCHVVMTNTLERFGKRAARAAVIRTSLVNSKTTLMLFRCRNVIEQRKSAHQIVAEEMILWGWRGTLNNREFLDHSEAKELLIQARATSELSRESRANFLENEFGLMKSLDEELDRVAEEQSKRLVEAHERFSALMSKDRFQVVYPVLPMDLLGIYVLLPEGSK